MRFQTLRKQSKKIGLFGLIFGVLVSAVGVSLGNVTVLGIGCLLLFLGAYAMIYAHVGSF